MSVIVFFSLPGLAVGLIVFAALDRLGWWLHGRSALPWYRDHGRPASAVGFDELQAAFHSGTRHAIEQRKVELVLRDDEHDGAPPRVRVDLERGRVMITRTGTRAARPDGLVLSDGTYGHSLNMLCYSS